MSYNNGLQVALYTTKTKYGKQRTNCWVSNNGCQQADVEA